MLIVNFILQSISEFFQGIADSFLLYGIVLVPAIFLILIYALWMDFIVKEYFKQIKYVILSFSVPTDLERTPKIAEMLFSGLHGIQTSPNFVERYFKGKRQEWFSFEIVSINGEVRFLVRTPDYYKDLVESHVYAQYPEAEISQIRDYVDVAPDTYPDDEFDFFGTEYMLSKADAYPIRTYKSFEGPTPETTVDSLAALMEVLGNIGAREQIWVQLLARPVSDSWKENGEKLVKKLAGIKKEERKQTLPEEIIRKFGAEAGEIARRLPTASIDFEQTTEEKKKSEDKSPPSKIQFLTPGEVDVIKAIQENISKTGFEVKLRFIYFTTNEIFKKVGKARINGIRGALEKPYSTINLNGFKMNKLIRTKVDYFERFRIPRRKRIMMKKYKTREFDDKGFVLNTEELATLFHFPDISVRTATVKRTEAKKGDSPPDLPLDIPFE